MIDFDAQRPRKLAASKPHKQARAPKTEALPAMTEDDGFELEFETVEISQHGLAQSTRAASRLNDVMAVCIAVFLFLIPVPYGANNALAWLLAAVTLGAMVVVYYALISVFDPTRPSQLRQHRLILGLGGVVLLGALAQLLPVNFSTPTWLPEGLALTQISLVPEATKLGVMRLMSYGLLFVLVLEVCTNRYRTERLLYLIYVGIVTHAIWALVSLSFLNDTLLFAEKTAYQGFATGTFINRNSFATYLAMGCVIGMARLLMQMRGPRQRSPRLRSSYRGLTIDSVVQLVWLFLLFAALLATGSRLGVAAGFVGAFTVMMIMLLKTHARPLTIMALAGVSLVLLLGLIFGMTGAARTADRLAFLWADSSARLEIFRQSWDMLMARPWLGYGLDSYPIAIELFRQPEFPTSLTLAQPHNTYLTLWLDYGILLGSVTILMILLAFGQLIRAVVQRELAFLPASVAVAVIVLCAVHSLGDFSLEIAANVYVFITLVALGLAKRTYSRVK